MQERFRQKEKGGRQLKPADLRSVKIQHIGDNPVVIINTGEGSINLGDFPNLKNFPKDRRVISKASSRRPSESERKLKVEWSPEDKFENQFARLTLQFIQEVEEFLSDKAQNFGATERERFKLRKFLGWLAYKNRNLSQKLTNKYFQAFLDVAYMIAIEKKPDSTAFAKLDKTNFISEQLTQRLTELRNQGKKLVTFEVADYSGDRKQFLGFVIFGFIGQKIVPLLYDFDQIFYKSNAKTVIQKISESQFTEKSSAKIPSKKVDQQKESTTKPELAQKEKVIDEYVANFKSYVFTNPEKVYQILNDLRFKKSPFIQDFVEGIIKVDLPEVNKHIISYNEFTNFIENFDKLKRRSIKDRQGISIAVDIISVQDNNKNIGLIYIYKKADKLLQFSYIFQPEFYKKHSNELTNQINSLRNKIRSHKIQPTEEKAQEPDVSSKKFLVKESKEEGGQQELFANKERVLNDWIRQTLVPELNFATKSNKFDAIKGLENQFEEMDLQLSDEQWKVFFYGAWTHQLNNKVHVSRIDDLEEISDVVEKFRKLTSKNVLLINVPLTNEDEKKEIVRGYFVYSIDEERKNLQYLASFVHPNAKNSDLVKKFKDATNLANFPGEESKEQPEDIITVPTTPKSEQESHTEESKSKIELTQPEPTMVSQRPIPEQERSRDVYREELKNLLEEAKNRYQKYIELLSGEYKNILPYFQESIVDVITSKTFADVWAKVEEDFLKAQASLSTEGGPNKEVLLRGYAASLAGRLEESLRMVIGGFLILDPNVRANLGKEDVKKTLYEFFENYGSFEFMNRIKDQFEKGEVNLEIDIGFLFSGTTAGSKYRIELKVREWDKETRNFWQSLFVQISKECRKETKAIKKIFRKNEKLINFWLKAIDADIEEAQELLKQARQAGKNEVVVELEKNIQLLEQRKKVVTHFLDKIKEITSLYPNLSLKELRELREKLSEVISKIKSSKEKQAKISNWRTQNLELLKDLGAILGIAVVGTLAAFWVTLFQFPLWLMVKMEKEVEKYVPKLF